ncbi:MAG: hypothetical protein ABS76_20960 [Pelagibacterium sp. SCN 64-44]|nr:MAG: hypothetical protein ABS76_20960 [Pelagibacterium sp. SCN 64-44]
MHKILIIAATALSLAACTTTQQGATVGAIGGGIVGATATGNVVGAAVGAGIGAVAGAAAGELLGYYGTSRDRCVYRDPQTGRQYIDTCPRG